ncbi:MAG: hypothetical protein J7619_09770 [Dyadobacter sp.]|uniref:hypothetical protein n=1 Tax=Dyadobacter sp. TaxID=1914288 RepID=UPI001AFE3D6C|nr:hypothetical protein [Dyadobacter sp.]MBO9612972.1 hypothetical protein [Dyadobacter sp.]
MKKTRLFLFLSLFCAACMEQPEEPLIIIDPPAEPVIIAARFYLTDQSHYKVEYRRNSNNLMEQEIQYKENGDTLLVSKYKYLNYQLAEQQIGINPNIAGFTYQYKGDTLIAAEYKESAASPKPQHFTRTYSYPEKNIVRIVEQNMLTKAVQHTYLYLQQGNIVRTKVLDPVTDQVKEETQFEYDEHPNPYYTLTGRDGLPAFRSQRNVTLIKTLVRNGESVNSEIRYAYDYTGPWPVKKYQVLANNQKFLEQEYIYNR